MGGKPLNCIDNHDTSIPLLRIKRIPVIVTWKQLSRNYQLYLASRPLLYGRKLKLAVFLLGTSLISIE